MITDEKSDPPIIPGTYQRDEEEQVRHLRDMVGVYEAEHIDSVFWFTFAGFEQPRHPTDPHRDLDLASYGVVAVLEHERGTTYPDIAPDHQAGYTKNVTKPPPPGPKCSERSGMETSSRSSRRRWYCTGSTITTASMNAAWDARAAGGRSANSC